MIISASRRTDIPAFYADWFIRRIRAGYCCVINPYNRNQVTRISLKRDDVDVIVFWTKNAKPMLPKLQELDDLGYRYYFQYTLTGYDKRIEPNSVELEKAIGNFLELSDKVGAPKVIWRYDPIIISELLPLSYHLVNFRKITESLRGNTKRVVISIVDDYRGTRKRIIETVGSTEVNLDITKQIYIDFFRDIAHTAFENGMEIQTCSEEYDLTPYGITHGKCIDDTLIKSLFDIQVSAKKDKTQRNACGCVESKDIGAYDTCPYGCTYCYATKNISTISQNEREHLIDSPSLIGRRDVPQTNEEHSDQYSLL